PPRSIDKAIPFELETIVLKTLAKSPTERYGTAQELANDLRRFLDDKPIMARRPTLLQRLRSWWRRHRPVVWSAAVSALVLLLMALAALAVGYVYVSAEKNEKEKALERAKANAADAEEQRRLAQANLDLARQAVDDLSHDFTDRVVDMPRMQPARRRSIQRTLDFYQEFAKQKSRDPEIRWGTGLAYLRINSM